MFSSILQRAGFKPSFSMQSSIPRLLMAAALVGGAGSLLSAGSAKAITTCSFGGFAGTACATGAGGILAIGDKTVTFSTLPTVGQGTITFLNSVQDFFALKTNFQDSALLAPASGLLEYDISITSGLQNFKGVQLSVDAFGKTTTEESELSSPSRFVTLTSTNSLSPIPNSSLFETVNFTGLTTLKVKATYDLVNPASLSSFTSTFEQTAIPKAPAPLPLLGAGMALGFSRKLRSRIKASASAKA